MFINKFLYLQLFSNYNFVFVAVQVTEAVEPSSLHHLVWLGVQCLSVLNKESICNILLPLKFSVGSLNSLQFSQNSITSNYAESLCKLDIDAFLYACGMFYSYFQIFLIEIKSFMAILRCYQIT